MNLQNILATSTISTVLIGLVMYIFRDWIKIKITKSIQHQYDIDLENYKNNLNRELQYIKSKLQAEFEIYKTSITRYSNEQFKIYNELWIVLCELMNTVDQLWANASNHNLVKLSGQLIAAKDKIKKSALILDPSHYNELMKIICVFEEYKFGKMKLVEYKKENIVSMVKTGEIMTFIGENQIIKKKLQEYLSKMQSDFRGKISTGIIE